MPAWSNFPPDRTDVVERDIQPPFTQRGAAFRPARKLGLDMVRRQFALAQADVDKALDGRVEGRSRKL